jgi:arsenate reductase (thioredoxin)
MNDRPSVLFVCVHNAGRSQMAAGFLRSLAGAEVEVRSAGTAPANTVNAVVIEAMREEGIDLRAETPKVLDPAMVQTSDVVITMGCGDECPYFPGRTYLDWELPDPAGKDLAAVRPIRDAVRERVVDLMATLQVGDRSPDDSSGFRPAPGRDGSD